MVNGQHRGQFNISSNLRGKMPIEMSFYRKFLWKITRNSHGITEFS